MIRGRCVIPVENIKLYHKVVKRLKKDHIQFEEEWVESADWTAMTSRQGKDGRTLTPEEGVAYVNQVMNTAGVIITYKL